MIWFVFEFDCVRDFVKGSFKLPLASGLFYSYFTDLYDGKKCAVVCVILTFVADLIFIFICHGG